MHVTLFVGASYTLVLLPYGYFWLTPIECPSLGVQSKGTCTNILENVSNSS